MYTHNNQKVTIFIARVDTVGPVIGAALFVINCIVMVLVVVTSGKLYRKTVDGQTLRKFFWYNKAILSMQYFNRNDSVDWLSN